ncbi:histidine kinase [Microtetraspora sp. NBRC 13810]|uniref:sensor histidine kinase n=1 Tax=Microtetraspora sp. NBRC 13810 TaxID=3030990 RepID=UPI0024A08A6F|nr:sensor histidine kinase [Microtetraspora sp. NBRC 13810]GLW07824.1 histidine kinase [Microtetraspora sp. NBRC 13810]
MARTFRLSGWSLARQMLALQIVVVGVTVAGSSFFTLLHTRDLLTEEASRVAMGVAISVADSPSVLTALATPDPTKTLQPYAERIRRQAGVDFVTIMSPRGRRYTHPNPAEIGKPFLGNTAPALAGHTFTETYSGTLGLSVRAVTPVLAPDGGVRGLVSAGITVDTISARLRAQLGMAAVAALIGLAVGGAGAVLVGTRLRRQTHGLAAAELGRIYEHHDAILHAVREGLLLIDAERRLTLCNDGARDLLGLPPDAEGRHVAGLPLPRSLTDLLTAGEDRTDEIHLTQERVLVVNMAVVRSGARRLGFVVTLRDHTELQALSGQLDAVRGFAESLRSAAHESANRLHTVVTLVELGRTEQAVAFATSELHAAQQLTDRVVGAVREPVLAALLLGKTAEASERGVELSITPDSELDDIGLDQRDLVTVVGNLIDNAIDAAVGAGPPARVRVHLRGGGQPAGPRPAGGDGVPGEILSGDGVSGEILIRVEDSGPGLGEQAAKDAFRRGWTTKGDGRGLGLAMVGQTVRRLGGTIEVGTTAPVGDPDRPGAGAPGGEGAGRGAVFTVRLPLPRATARPAAQPAAGQGAGQGAGQDDGRVSGQGAGGRAVT